MSQNEKQRSTQEIYQILRQEILDLTLPPGATIGENEMTKRFQLSRTPIREVFKRLEIEGLVKVIPNKGTVITPINFAEINEFMYVREKLEIGLVEDLLPILGEESLVILKVNLLKQEKIVQDIDSPLCQRAQAFYELDNQFHKTIFACMHKETLWQMLTDMMPSYIRYRAVSAEFNTQEHIQDLYQHHCNIMDAFENKNLPKLKESYKQHIYYGIKTFRQLISEKESYFLL